LQENDFQSPHAPLCARLGSRFGEFAPGDPEALGLHGVASPQHAALVGGAGLDLGELELEGPVSVSELDRLPERAKELASELQDLVAQGELGARARGGTWWVTGGCGWAAWGRGSFR
jgi:hypothetical protein